MLNSFHISTAASAASGGVLGMPRRGNASGFARGAGGSRPLLQPSTSGLDVLLPSTFPQARIKVWKQ